MKCYVDLYTEPDNMEEAIEIIKYAKRLGYCILGMNPLNEWEEIEAAAKRRGIRLVKVIVIDGTTRREVARKASRVSNGSVLLVRGTSQDVARYASVNKRYAGFIVVPGLERLVDKSTKHLFDERGWGIVVVQLRDLLGKRSRSTWKYYYISLRRAFAYGISLALVSSARNKDELWHPMSAAGIAEIVGVPGEYALMWLTSDPAKILKAYPR